MSDEITYEQLHIMLRTESIRLIDVRTPDEIMRNGKMDGSINIPINDIRSAFMLSEEEFYQNYEIPKPTKDDENLVFHCQSGKRSRMALDAVSQLGYANARHYKEGFLGWIQKKSKRKGSRAHSSNDDPLSKTPKKDNITDIDQDATKDHSNRAMFIKAKFGVDMPEDFYKFYDFCQELHPAAPLDALLDSLQLKLVGVFDALAGRFDDIDESTITSYHLHWRFQNDPPEFMTVLAQGEEKPYHIGYFRDDPNSLPDLVASNTLSSTCELQCLGSNLFAAVLCYIDNVLAKRSVTKKKSIQETRDKLQQCAKRNNFDLTITNKTVQQRKKRVVANTFHKLGIVVPVDKVNDVGYRPLGVKNAALHSMLENIKTNKDEKARLKALQPLEELITYIQFANDECDYGMGLELGVDLFCKGQDFDSFTRQLLTTAYTLLDRTLYADIISIHIKNRKRERLSQI